MNKDHIKAIILYVVIALMVLVFIEVFGKGFKKEPQVDYTYSEMVKQLEGTAPKIKKLEIKALADGTAKVKAYLDLGKNVVIDVPVLEDFTPIVSKAKTIQKDKMEIVTIDIGDPTDLTSDSDTIADFTRTQIIDLLQTRDIVSISVKVDSDVPIIGTATVAFKDNTTALIHISNLESFMGIVNDSIARTNIQVIQVPPSKVGLIMSLIPYLFTAGIIVFIFFFVMQQMQGGSGGNRAMSFGKSKAKISIDDKNKTTFDQVAGLDEEKVELSEIVEFLKQPKKFTDIGARIPKGVLLVGPPGTGKTLLAKAVSGEAGVPFFSISGSEFVEMFVGVGASRVRDLFEQAKKNAPCLVFIDEIDAVGRKRGAGLGGGHDEREQTLNQLLVEMDGFAVNEGVIVIAATNRADILDPALMRPGRFDRQVAVGAPDVRGREEILQVHAKGKQIDPEVDFKVIAKTTPGFTGADLENLLNEAALLAARENKKKVDMSDLKSAFIKIGMGTEKKSKVISEKDRRITAYHEAGHAIMFEGLSELDPVHMISIIPTGRAGGYTMPLSDEDRSHISKRYMKQYIVALLGGRAAEEVVLDDITTGASNDIERATGAARSMVTKYGMSEELGPIQFGDDDHEIFVGREWGHSRNYGEEMASLIDREVKKIVKDAYQEALRLINENIEALHKTAAELIEKEKLSGDEFRAIFSGGSSADVADSADKKSNETIDVEI